ncbi:hypothetical protein GGR56DRAFT_645483 [Xylariaceae sp. FL0804]|nr:hypothetical protein GGR56DRAFT_645483 [Xylariaceae sp. FL0804]
MEDDGNAVTAFCDTHLGGSHTASPYSGFGPSRVTGGAEQEKGKDKETQQYSNHKNNQTLRHAPNCLEFTSLQQLSQLKCHWHVGLISPTPFIPTTSISGLTCLIKGSVVLEQQSLGHQDLQPLKRCVRCRYWFTESHNSEIACAYHPGCAFS